MIKHCPLCGKYPHMSNSDEEFWIECENCWIMVSGDEGEKVRINWNRLSEKRN